MIIYAIKDTITNLYYNRIHKDLRELSQNTAFYKTKNGALSELNPLHQFIQGKILKSRRLKELNIKRCDNYESQIKYVKENINTIKLMVVEIEMKEK